MKVRTISVLSQQCLSYQKKNCHMGQNSADDNCPSIKLIDEFCPRTKLDQQFLS